MNKLVSSGLGAVQSAKMGFRKVSHVIFDMDGLLLGNTSISLCLIDFLFVLRHEIELFAPLAVDWKP